MAEKLDVEAQIESAPLAKAVVVVEGGSRFGADLPLSCVWSCFPVSSRVDRAGWCEAPGWGAVVRLRTGGVGGKEDEDEGDEDDEDAEADEDTDELEDEVEGVKDAVTEQFSSFTISVPSAATGRYGRSLEGSAETVARQTLFPLTNLRLGELLWYELELESVPIELATVRSSGLWLLAVEDCELDLASWKLAEDDFGWFCTLALEEDSASSFDVFRWGFGEE